MSEKKDIIKYNILEMNNGSGLLLTTNNKELIGAIRHQVLRQENTMDTRNNFNLNFINLDYFSNWLFRSRRQV